MIGLLKILIKPGAGKIQKDQKLYGIKNK